MRLRVTEKVQVRSDLFVGVQTASELSRSLEPYPTPPLLRSGLPPIRGRGQKGYLYKRDTRGSEKQRNKEEVKTSGEDTCEGSKQRRRD
eukprot:749834-Hanusia_phi.AAC.1